MNLQKKIKVQKIVAYVLITLQFLGYLGSTTGAKDAKMNEPFTYYLGFNIFLIIGVILLFNVQSLKRKLRTKNQEDQINSIGQAE